MAFRLVAAEFTRDASVLAISRMCRSSWSVALVGLRSLDGNRIRDRLAVSDEVNDLNNSAKQTEGPRSQMEVVKRALATWRPNT